MGAIPYSGGVAFRVWAPFANTVFGEFNGWSTTANPLAREESGNWSVDIPGAGVRQKYKYIIEGRWKIDPRAKAVTNSVGEGIIVAADFPWRINNFGLPAWNEMAIYQMHVGTFPDDPVAVGDMFTAIIHDMEYLKELGINVIQLLPTQEFPTDSSWGYNPTHVFAVESGYGDPEELKRFIDAAHEHGLAVILDVVYNHFGPSDLEHSVWQFDGWFEHWDREEMGGIYFYNDWRAHTPWGHKNRPDYGRPEIRQFIRDNALMWLEEYRFDGLRFDATKKG